MPLKVMAELNTDNIEKDSKVCLFCHLGSICGNPNWFYITFPIQTTKAQNLSSEMWPSFYHQGYRE